MKKLLLGLFLITISSNAFSNITREQRSVIRAIGDSLRTHILLCTDSISGDQVYSSTITPFKFLHRDVKMKINENSKPNIELEGSLSGDSGQITRIQIITNSSFTKVTRMKLTILEETDGPDINTGTIIRPSYKTKIIEKIYARYDCKEINKN